MVPSIFVTDSTSIIVLTLINPLETGKCSAPRGSVGPGGGGHRVSIPWTQGSALRPADSSVRSPRQPRFNPLETGKCSAPLGLASGCQQRVCEALLPSRDDLRNRAGKKFLAGGRFPCLNPYYIRTYNSAQTTGKLGKMGKCFVAEFPRAGWLCEPSLGGMEYKGLRGGRRPARRAERTELPKNARDEKWGAEHFETEHNRFQRLFNPRASRFHIFSDPRPIPSWSASTCGALRRSTERLTVARAARASGRARRRSASPTRRAAHASARRSTPRLRAVAP